MTLIIVLIFVAVLCLIASNHVGDPEGSTILKWVGIIAGLGAALLLVLLVAGSADGVALDR